MPRSEPHPLALFSLIPLNPEAEGILTNPDNAHLIFTDAQGLLGIDIGLHINSSTRTTLATLGRSGDVTVQAPSISRIQCSFEINEEFGTVMLYDRSHSQSTQVFQGDGRGDDRGDGQDDEESRKPKLLPFVPGNVRRVPLAKDLNVVLGMGGVGCDLFRFRMKWFPRELHLTELVKTRVDNPRLARTVDEIPTTVPSARLTRIHTPRDSQTNTRYVKLEALGRGQFGEVYKAITESGGIMAVKVVPRSSPEYHRSSFKREIEALSRFSHPSIVEYLGYQPTRDTFEMFMALKDGSVESLVLQNMIGPETATRVLHDVLMGLDYLSDARIIHRDLKPANILFTKKSTSDMRFQIADFGLCNLVDNARTFAGSLIFMAPEVLQHDASLQTCKVDVWSLFVTMAYVLNVNGYRHLKSFKRDDIIANVQQAAETSTLLPLKNMAVVDPGKRASAADMLQKLFNGEGLATRVAQRRDASPPKIVVNSLSMKPTLSRPTPSKSGASARVVKRTGRSRTNRNMMQSLQQHPQHFQ